LPGKVARRLSPTAIVRPNEGCIPQLIGATRGGRKEFVDFTDGRARKRAGIGAIYCSI